MATIWDEKPDYVWVPRGYSSRVKIKDDDIQMLNLEETDAWLENLKAKITQLNECLGEYESKEWCDHCIIDSKCAKITLYVQKLKEKAEKWEKLENSEAFHDIIVKASKLEAVKTAFGAHRDNLLELSGNLNQIAHEPELPEEYHYAIEKIATNMISYGELRKILEAEE